MRMWFRERVAKDDDDDVRSAAVQELARGWKDDPDTLPLLKNRAANDDDDDVRRLAVQELARGWKDDADTLPLLKEGATNDDDEDVRRAAVRELARGWKDDPDCPGIPSDASARGINLNNRPHFENHTLCARFLSELIAWQPTLSLF